MKTNYWLFSAMIFFTAEMLVAVILKCYCEMLLSDMLVADIFVADMWNVTS